MKARDVMTTSIVSVQPETPVREIAVLMTEKHISGVPVLAAAGQVVGIVSQGDLLHRREIGTEAKRSWWLRMFADPDRMARDYAKSHGLKAIDVMSRPVTSVEPDTELVDVAAILNRRGIKRVAVVDKGRIVGMLTRTDLVKAFSRVPAAAAVTVDDATLQSTLTDKMRVQHWLEASFVNVVVRNGVVQLWGYIGSEDQRRALRVLLEGTEGVKKVEDALTVGRLNMGAV